MTWAFIAAISGEILSSNTNSNFLKTITDASSNNDSLSLVVSALGIMVGFILWIASYLISHQEPEVNFWNFSEKHDVGLILNNVTWLIRIKKDLLSWLPKIYGITFIWLLIVLFTIQYKWVMVSYIIIVIVIFIYVSIKIHAIISKNTEISDGLHNLSQKRYKVRCENWK
jgi:ABC-type multidrug transport system fused ATPase/permease subunit